MTTIKELNSPIVNEDFATPVKDSDGLVLTVRTCLKRAALINDDSEKIGHGEKFDNWMLAKQIHEAGDSVTVSEKDAEKLKTYIGKAFGSLVVGQLLSRFSKCEVIES